MPNLLDTHIHLDLLDRVDHQLVEARAAGISGWVVPGICAARWPDLLEIVGRTEGAFAAPGVHPGQAQSFKLQQLDELQRLLEVPQVVAIGEVGLDRAATASQTLQEEVFVAMLRLARDAQLPLLLHSRRSVARTLELLRREDACRCGGIFHAFSGSRESALEIVRAGFAIGLGGVLTWPEARRLPSIINDLPAEALVLESDAPDMAPSPHRGEANRAANLALVAARLSELRGWSAAETARITSANARRVLRLGDASG
jgi:TatD DNase family protein